MNQTTTRCEPRSRGEIKHVRYVFDISFVICFDSQHLVHNVLFGLLGTLLHIGLRGELPFIQGVNIWDFISYQFTGGASTAYVGPKSCQKWVFQAPSIPVIHTGRNDLCFIRMAELVSLISSDLKRFSLFFTKLVIVWSEIEPRVVWWGARNPSSIERARRILNAQVSRHVRSHKGVAIWHRQLGGDDHTLLGKDGIPS